MKCMKAARTSRLKRRACDSRKRTGTLFIRNRHRWDNPSPDIRNRSGSTPGRKIPTLVGVNEGVVKRRDLPREGILPGPVILLGPERQTVHEAFGVSSILHH